MHTESAAAPSFGQALRYWLKLGFISFGGPSGQIAMMHDDLVEKKKWISESHFLHALNYCMLLPGPEAQQLAIYCGWLLHRTWGGIVAGVLFVLPSALLLFALSWLYMAGRDVSWLTGIFYGLKAAVIAIVFTAVLRIGRKALKNGVMWGIALASFVGICFLHLPFPLIIGAAALFGWLGGKWWRARFLVIKGHGGAGEGSELSTPEISPSVPLTWGRFLKIVSLCLVLWWVPVLLVGACFGWSSAPAQQGLFFSKAAMVTFGGAYAVLPYVGQQAVEHYGWLSTGQMMDGLGLAETTPGPLIMVLQFVGFVGGWQHPLPGWSPLATAALGSALTTWVTFVPCFLWIFLGAPYIQKLRSNERLSCALSAITAAVVGVILNLAIWFALHALLPNAWAAANPSWRIDWFILASAAFFLWLIQKRKWEILPVVGLAALAGMVWHLATAGGFNP